MDESHRFRRTLKDPIVVISLCLIAGFAVYSNMVNFTPDTPGIISVGLNQLLSTPTPPPFTPTHRTHEEEAERWIDQPERDPFAPIPVAFQPRPESSSTTAPPRPMKELRLKNGLTLKAIAVEGQQRSAVINRTVVYEGEMIEGYQVMSIHPEGVWLKHQGKTQLLTFSEKTTS